MPKRAADRAKEIVDHRYAEDVDIETLARSVKLSPAYFTRQFRRAFGITPHQYLVARRMRRAAALMRGTDYSVASVCARVGLRSVGSFTTRFVRTFAVSPVAYRASHPPAAQLARFDALGSVDCATGKKCSDQRAITVAVRRGPNALGMTLGLTHVTIWVRDQDEALEFYTSQLGMEVRVDVLSGREDPERWLTVGPPAQPDIAFILRRCADGDPTVSPADRRRAGCFHLRTEDCWASYAELRGRGVNFVETPAARPYGIRAAFCDPTGNVFHLVEPTQPSRPQR